MRTAYRVKITCLNLHINTAGNLAGNESQSNWEKMWFVFRMLQRRLVVITPDLASFSFAISCGVSSLYLITWDLHKFAQRFSRFVPTVFLWSTSSKHFSIGHDAKKLIEFHLFFLNYIKICVKLEKTISAKFVYLKNFISIWETRQMSCRKPFLFVKLGFRFGRASHRL